MEAWRHPPTPTTHHPHRIESTRAELLQLIEQHKSDIDALNIQLALVGETRTAG